MTASFFITDPKTAGDCALRFSRKSRLYWNTIVAGSTVCIHWHSRNKRKPKVRKFCFIEFSGGVAEHFYAVATPGNTVCHLFPRPTLPDSCLLEWLGNDHFEQNAVMEFEIIGEITTIDVIAVGKNIRELPRLYRFFAKGRWRKLKEIAHVKLSNRSIRLAEVHWYEAHGIGRKEMKRNRYLK